MLAGAELVVVLVLDTVVDLDVVLELVVVVVVVVAWELEDVLVVVPVAVPGIHWSGMLSQGRHLDRLWPDTHSSMGYMMYRNTPMYMRLNQCSFRRRIAHMRPPAHLQARQTSETPPKMLLYAPFWIMRKLGSGT